MAISTQIQNLNLIPGKSAPVVVHLSQGNVGDTVKFYLYDGDNPYYPTNVSIAVHGVRADGSVFGPYAVSITSGSNLVSFDIVTAMTSVTGAEIGELVITDTNQNQVGTANFGMLIEETPYSSSVTYEDDLSIYQRILAYVQSIPAELREEFNEALELKAEEFNEALEFKTGWFYTPEMFGAVGDDVTDDSAAFQAMFDALKEGDIVYLTKPKYRCDAPLVLTQNQVRITGAGASTEYWPSIITSIDSGTLLTVRAAGLGMNNVSLRRRYAATDSTTVTLLAIDADTTELQGNADTELVNCHFFYANTGVTVKGRNLLLNGVTLSSCYTGVLLENTQLDTDNRGFNIINCKFHGCNLCIRNNINNARTWRNVNVNSNFADISSAFFVGYGGNVNITDNLIDLFAGDKKDIAIVIMADELNPSVYQNVIANNHIIMRDQSGKGITVGVGCKCMIKDNIIENCLENGIDIMNAPVICTGNVLNNCGRGDGFYPIFVRAGSSGFLLFNVLVNTSKPIYLTSGHTMTVANNYPA